MDDEILEKKFLMHIDFFGFVAGTFKLNLVLVQLLSVCNWQKKKKKNYIVYIMP